MNTKTVGNTLLAVLLLSGACLVPAEAAQAQVDIYVTSWCPYCQRLETFLKENRIQYSRHDVEANEKAGREFEAMGGTGVPLVRVGKEVIHGFDTEGIIRSLKAQS